MNNMERGLPTTKLLPRMHTLSVLKFSLSNTFFAISIQAKAVAGASASFPKENTPLMLFSVCPSISLLQAMASLTLDMSIPSSRGCMGMMPAISLSSESFSTVLKAFSVSTPSSSTALLTGMLSFSAFFIIAFS